MGPATAILVAGTLTAVASFAKGDVPRPRVFIGTGIAGIIVLGLAAVNPQAGQGLGTLVLITSILTNGYDVATAIGKVTN